MSKRDVSRGPSATEWTASVRTARMSQRTASIVQVWCHGMDCVGTHCTHVETCDVTRVQSATEWIASAHTAHMSKRVTLLAFKVLRNGLHRYTLRTCQHVWCHSCSKCYGMDCIGTHCAHVNTCDVTRVQSATEWIASVHTAHMSTRVMSLVFKVLRNGLHRYTLRTCQHVWCNACSKCYGMDCIGTHCAHVNTCDVTRVQSATEWIASVHTTYRSKRVMQRVVEVRRNELHGYNMHRARWHCLGGFLDRGFRIIVWHMDVTVHNSIRIAFR